MTKNQGNEIRVHKYSDRSSAPPRMVRTPRTSRALNESPSPEPRDADKICNFVSASDEELHIPQIYSNDQITNTRDLFNAYNTTRKIWDGDLIIKDTQILLLANIFPNLTTINGNLHITNTYCLSIQGFDRLTHVTGSLVIANNENAASIPSFPQLQSVSAVIIANNKVLRKIVGFEHLTQSNRGIFIVDNCSLTHVCGFLCLSETNNVAIKNNTNLNSIVGFCSLTTVHEKLVIASNNTNSSNNLAINAFLLLESVSSVSIINNDGLKELEFRALQQIHNRFDVTSNPNLELIICMAKIIGSIDVQKNDRLVSISFPETEELTGELLVHRNNSLKTLDTFEELQRIGGGLIISDNKQLQYLRGFCDTKIIKSYCPHDRTYKKTKMYSSNIYCNDNFEHKILYEQQLVITLPSFGENVNSNLSIMIFGNPSLRYVNGFGDLKLLESSLYIANNISLTHIDAFTHLVSVVDIWIKNNPQLKHIEGLNNLVSKRSFVVDKCDSSNKSCRLQNIFAITPRDICDMQCYSY